MLQRHRQKAPEIHRINVGTRRCTECGYDGAQAYVDRPDATLRIACPNCGANIVLTPDDKEETLCNSTIRKYEHP